MAHIEHGIIGEFPYCIWEHNELLCLNGYLGVNHSHPWYRKNWNEIDVNVHGGLTFADSNETGAAFLSEQNFPGLDIWWVGFDCGHAWDIMPGLEKSNARLNLGTFPWPEGATYKDRDFVYNELENLAKQASVAIQVLEVLDGSKKEL